MFTQKHIDHFLRQFVQRQLECNSGICNGKFEQFLRRQLFEYGRKFVNWDYIREAAEPDEWLSFLRDLPQYAAEADWKKLASEGSKESLQALLALRPELEKYL